MQVRSTSKVIVEEADALFYARGFGPTSFADIAKAVGISRGNFYHHFKSKDDILDAVITRRIAGTRTMLERWEAEGGDPVARIRCFIRILIVNRTGIRLHGCPVGTLSSELAKLDHQAHGRAAEIFALFRDWLAGQFRLLDCAEPEALALHLLSRSQGVAVLFNAFHDEAFLNREVDELCAWLDGAVAQGS